MTTKANLLQERYEAAKAARKAAEAAWKAVEEAWKVAARKADEEAEEALLAWRKADEEANKEKI